MSAQDEGGRDPPKPKGKTLGSFFGSLPGFSSAQNQVAHAHSSAREARPVAHPTGAPAAETAQPQAEVATDPEQTTRDVEKTLPLSDRVRGAGRAWSGLTASASPWVPPPGMFQFLPSGGCHRPRSRQTPQWDSRPVFPSEPLFLHL